MNAIGIIELSSIAKGFETQDAVLKDALVEKLIARTICSGKYLILVRGEVGDVESAMGRARDIGAYAIINCITIPNIHEKVFPAIAGPTSLDMPRPDGLAVIETFSVASAICAADYAVKEADVHIVRIHVSMAIGGKGVVILTGGIDALRSAIIPAIDFVKEEGMLAGHCLITHPHESMFSEWV
jgi:microcompartment protein CcmL/EutN